MMKLADECYCFRLQDEAEEQCRGFMYDSEYVYRYELYAANGRRGARIAYEASIERRKTGKALKVVEFPQGGAEVPAIRVAGRWLERFGFALGDDVVLRARQGKIVITKRSVERRER